MVCNYLYSELEAPVIIFDLTGENVTEKADQFMVQHRSQVSAAIVRESQRLSHYAWECKIWQCPTEIILLQLNQQP
ncbi:MAG TPA: hypothetical protein DDW76_34635 [Cyanobacteria bacterium UBA11369]|nr:hypothetical protein [Cyanobacteria bacterium UBA11368]HBE53751.1 hypothetical protein [Cyanobacteria bacterium UBA11369]